MIGLYTRLLARCRTVNQVHQVHIALETRMTPPDVRELEREVLRRLPGTTDTMSLDPASRGGQVAAAVGRSRPATAFPPEAHAWVAQLSDWAAKSGKAEPEPFVRRRVRPNVLSFSAGGRSVSKTLVVCFTGMKGRLFMPIPVVLQHLPSADFDLIVLRDPSRNGYRSGVAGVANDFAGLADAVGGLFDRRAYRAVVTYGISAGGLPAIVTALRLGLDKAVSVGGKGPLDPRWQDVCAGGVGAMLRDYARDVAAPPNLLYVHGADSPPDADSARDLAQVVPLRTLAVHGGEGREIGHNPLLPLLRRSRLGAFLASALDAGVAGFVRGHGSAPARIEV